MSIATHGLALSPSLPVRSILLREKHSSAGTSNLILQRLLGEKAALLANCSHDDARIISLLNRIAGCVDTFTIDGSNVGTLKCLRIEQKGGAPDASWLVDYVEVKHGSTGTVNTHGM